MDLYIEKISSPHFTPLPPPILRVLLRSSPQVILLSPLPPIYEN